MDSNFAEESLESILSDIKSQRMHGLATCFSQYDKTFDLENPHSLKEKIDLFVERVGFEGLGQDWVQINRSKSLKILTEILYKNIAYGTSVGNKKHSTNAAKKVMSFFDDSSKIFTNGNLAIPNADPNDEEGSFIGISESSFDTGVVIIDKEKVVIVWVQDDD